MSKVISVLSILGLTAAIGVGVHSYNTSFTDIAVSKSGVCGINDSGDIYCKGHDAPSRNSEWMFTEVAIPEEAGKAEALKMSDEGACAKTNSGSVYCWGNLTVKGKDLSDEDEPVKIADNVRDVAVGGQDVCVIESNTPWELHCTGKTLNSRLPALLQRKLASAGEFQTVPVMTSVAQKPLSQVFMNNTNICASTLGTEGKEGLMQCSGSNEYGQLLPGFTSKLPMPSIAVGNVPSEVGTVVRSVGLMENIIKSMAGENTPSSDDIVKPIFDRGTLKFTLNEKVLCGHDVKSKELFCQGGVGSFASSAVSGIKVKQYAADENAVCVVDDKNTLQCATSVKPIFHTVMDEGAMEDVKELNLAGGRVVMLDTDGEVSQHILN